MAGFLQGADAHGESQWAGKSRIIGPPWANLPTITVCFLGAHTVWSVVVSYASPYLLSLGLTKSWMAIVFLGGPLSGLIVQPLIGALADSSKSRFGRRRPYVVGGTLLCTGGMLLLGFTRPFTSIFVRPGTSLNDVLTIWLAVVSIYIIEFAINAVEVMNRALVVDTLSVSEQAGGNAWAACMHGIGGIVGFFVGYLDLPRIFPFFGKSQLGIFSILVSIILVTTQMVTTICVKEKVLISSKAASLRDKLTAFVGNALTLPPVIRQICVIQSFAWFAWFPARAYATLYVGELFKRSHPLPSFASESDILALDAEATRLGSRALFFSSVLSLGMNIVLPFLVAGAKGEGREVVSPMRGWLARAGMQVHLASLWAFSLAVFAGCMIATFFTSSVFGASVLMTGTGFCWAVTMWAPATLLGEAILTETDSAPTRGDVTPIRLATVRAPLLEEYKDGESEYSVGDEDERGDERVRSRWTSLDRQRVETGDVKGGFDEKAGIILAIHNTFIVIPQFLAIGLSAVVFAILDPRRSVLHTRDIGASGNGNGTVGFVQGAGEGEEAGVVGAPTDSVAVLLRLGGVSAAVAAMLCWRLARRLKDR